MALTAIELSNQFPIAVALALACRMIWHQIKHVSPYYYGCLIHSNVFDQAAGRIRKCFPTFGHANQIRTSPCNFKKSQLKM